MAWAHLIAIDVDRAAETARSDAAAAEAAIGLIVNADQGAKRLMTRMWKESEIEREGGILIYLFI